MKKFASIPVVLLMAAASASANTLVGETLKFERLYPNLATQQEPFQIREVSSGAEDVIHWGSVFGNIYGTMNPEAESIEYFANRVTSFLGSASTFDGFRVTGFSHPVTFASITSNTTGLNLELIYDATTVIVDVSGAQTAGGSFSISVTSVPEPANLILLASGLAMIALLRKFRSG